MLKPPPTTTRIEWDPLLVEQKKARRLRQLNIWEIPIIRLVGFWVICGITFLHNHFIFGAVDWPLLGTYTAIMTLYALASWAILALAFRGEESSWLGDLFLALDVPLMTGAIYVTGAENSLIFAILLLRVSDQSTISLKRGLSHAVLACLCYIGMIFYVASFEGRSISWGVGLCKLFMLGVACAYMTISARPLERLRRRNTDTVRMARELIHQLGEKSAQLRSAWDEAEAASRAKGEFLANVSHEVRTPMTGILGLVDVLLETDLEPPQKRHVEIIRDSAQSLLAILGDILDLSKVEAREMQFERNPVDLRKLVESVTHLFRGRIVNRDLTLSWEVAPEVPEWVICDPARLRQVLVNLVANAVKFTDRGGVKIDVDLSGKAPAREGSVRVQIRVTDTGPGIAEADLERLFEPFTQLDGAASRRKGGTGLGLAICSRLVEKLGGKILVESRLGEGSRFTVVLDLPVDRRSPEARRAGEEEAVELRPRAGAKILVVEDNPVNQLVILHQLNRIGCSAEAVGGGEEALRIMKRTPFDLIFMDCQMPGMDGYEATRQWRAWEQGSGQRLPIVALTAHALAEDRERCLAAGMDDYLTKPLRSSDLGSILIQWLPERGDLSGTGSEDSAEMARL